MFEKEAEEYAGKTYEMCSYSGLPYASDRRAREQSFIAGAEPREKRIEELEQQIDEMKCCENCMFGNTPKILLPCHICVAKDNWQLKEIKEK